MHCMWSRTSIFQFYIRCRGAAWLNSQPLSVVSEQHHRRAAWRFNRANGHCLVWDFTYPDILAASHLNRVAQHPGAVTNDAERWKSIKHSSLAAMPVAVETLGALGEDVLAVFQIQNLGCDGWANVVPVLDAATECDTAARQCCTRASNCCDVIRTGRIILFWAITMEWETYISAAAADRSQQWLDALRNIPVNKILHDNIMWQISNNNIHEYCRLHDNTVWHPTYNNIPENCRLQDNPVLQATHFKQFMNSAWQYSDTPHKQFLNSAWQDNMTPLKQFNSIPDISAEKTVWHSLLDKCQNIKINLLLLKSKQR